MFKKSVSELKSVQCLAVTGVLSALYIVLNAYIAIDIGANLRVTFGFLALAVIGMLYGPVVAVLAAVPCDLLAATLGPHAMNPIFTPNRMLEGFIYGVCLYGLLNRNYKASGLNWLIFAGRIVAARILAMVLCYFLINNYLIFHFSLPPGRAQEILAEGRTFWMWAWARNGLKNLIQFPVDLGLMYIMLPAAGVAYVHTIRRTA
jgi:ECF transporter S component (folate family)